MSRLYRKFKLDQLKLAAQKKKENDLLRQAGCLVEQPSEKLDPAFKKLADNLNVLAEKITAEIEQESAGDPIKVLRCEWAFFWGSSRAEAVKNLDPPEADELSNSFTKTPATVREMALSAADRFVDSALWDMNIFGNVILGAQAFSTANHFFGVYLGLKDPRVVGEYLTDIARGNAKRRYEESNQVKVSLLVEYLKNRNKWSSKKSAARELHEKYANGRFSFRTVSDWIYDRDLLEQIRKNHNL